MDIGGTITISSVTSALITIISGLFIKSYLSSYMVKKGQNMATKEDIAEITRKTEEVKSEFTSKLEVEKKLTTLEIENVKFEQNQLFKNYELFTQKRHECYPELYKLLEIANGHIRGLSGQKRSLSFENTTATDIEGYMREKNFTNFDLEFILQNWNQDRERALERLTYRLNKIEYEEAFAKFSEANDYFYYHQIYLSDRVEQTAEELKTALHSLWFNYDSDISVVVPSEKNDRLIEKINFSRTNLKNIMREELYSNGR